MVGSIPWPLSYPGYTHHCTIHLDSSMVQLGPVWGGTGGTVLMLHQKLGGQLVIGSH